MKDLYEAKQVLRRQLLSERDGLSVSDRAGWDRAIHRNLLGMPQVIEARTVFLFVSFASEVDTHALLDRFLAQGKSVAVPKMTSVRGTLLAVPIQSRDNLAPGPMGILEPRIVQSPVAHVDACITPGVGFTVRGDRLGYGAGYYDNWLLTNRPGCSIAIAYECQLREEIPVDDSDISVDRIVTQDRVIDCHAVRS